MYSRYNSIFDPNNPEAKKVKEDYDKDLLIFRDAYIGRDGRLYKFCKCIKHKTELLLSDGEIDCFDHSQCSSIEAFKSRFYNLEDKYLLSNK